MKHLKLFENFNDDVIYKLHHVRVIYHINGIMRIGVEKNSSIKIYGEKVIQTLGNKEISNITFKQTNWDEWKPIMEPLGYKLNPNIYGYPFENKESKLIFIFDIGDSWYILGYIDSKKYIQKYYLIDDKPNVIEKIKELAKSEEIIKESLKDKIEKLEDLSDVEINLMKSLGSEGVLRKHMSSEEIRLANKLVKMGLVEKGIRDEKGGTVFLLC